MYLTNFTEKNYFGFNLNTFKIRPDKKTRNHFDLETLQPCINSPLLKRDFLSGAVSSPAI